MISGYSAAVDSARILQAVAVRVLALHCYPWHSFVCSKDNIADAPSRGDMAMLDSMGAVVRAMAMPSVADLAAEEIYVPGWSATPNVDMDLDG